MFYHKHDGCAYVLWADYYDDVLAVLFAGALRQAGWRTRLVGLRGDTHTGCYGSQLVADIALSDALRCRELTICVVAPCAPEQIASRHDSRLAEFLQQAARQHAVFVAKPHIAGRANRDWPADGHTIHSDPQEVLPLLHLVLAQLEKVR